MGMRCSRVGCGGHAVASFCFDGRAALVWLDPLDPEHGVGAGVLCARHADTLTPPRGWHLQDRRTPTPRLWVDRPAIAGTDRAVETPVASPHDSGQTVAAHRVAAQADPLPFEAAAATVEDPTAAERCHPPLAPPADVDDLLDARSPLLARAFAASGSSAERTTSDR